MMGLIENLNNQSVGEDRILIGEDLKSGSSTADEDNDDGADDNDQHQHQNSIHLELTFRKFDNCNFISGFVCAFFLKICYIMASFLLCV